MKKVLIRAGMHPLDNFSPEHCMTHDVLGNNSGNMLYAYTMFRYLTTEETELVPTYYKYNYSDEEAEAINSRYSAFIIPLANAFKPYFMRELKGLTSLVKRLDIPCIVAGVGTNVMYGETLFEDLPYEETIRAFFKAVLEKSSIVGVRGEITGDYMKKLGFKEDYDYMVIGCPSMYCFGKGLNIRETNINENSAIAVNFANVAPDNILRFTANHLERLSDPYVVGQTLNELKFIYTGKPKYHTEDDIKFIPADSLDDRMYVEDRLRFPLNVPSWMDFMKGMEFSFGSRLHGNIAALQAGTPTIMICKDYRMEEISRYHGIPWIDGSRLSEDDSIFEYIDKMDLKKPEQIQEENYRRFIKFLEMNNVDHIYKNTEEGSTLKDVPLDRQMRGIEYLPMVNTIAGCTTDEILRRMEGFYPIYNSSYAKLLCKNDDLSRDNDELKDDIKSLKKENKSLRKVVNRKSVRLALKLTSPLSGKRRRTQ